MSLAAHTRLGPYEVTGLLGAGGMGEVYEARDLRLNRTVAIKVLPAEFSADPGRLARFEREARAVAALNHPHICTLFDIGVGPVSFPGPDAAPKPAGSLLGEGGPPPSPESRIPNPEPVHYLVMEHIVGQTLAERLALGALSLPQALEIGAQIADALDAAHKHGIIHRDLKPGNVMLTAGGTGRTDVTAAKLLDFGLAKLAAHGEKPAVAGDVSVPTRAAPVTAEGTILGTVPYMAPEQLEGREADARTDLWALGAILYEMVTGRRAFRGDSQVSLVGNIMNAEPDPVAALQPLTPPALARLIARCLAKQPDGRWDSAHDVADELRWIAQCAMSSAPDLPAPSRYRVWAGRGGWLAAGVCVAVLGAVAAAQLGLTGWGPQRAGEHGAVAHLDLVLPQDAPLWLDPDTRRPSFAISPDGSSVAYACPQGGGVRLCLKRFDGAEVSVISGTDGALLPAFSTDGQSVYFCASGRNEYCEPGAAVKRLSIAGGRVDSLGTVPEGHPVLSLEPTDDGRILLAGWGGIWATPAGGGAAASLYRANVAAGETAALQPVLLPGGHKLIFTAVGVAKGSHYKDICLLDLRSGERRVLVKRARMARYLSGGHLLYADGVFSGSLLVASFDAGTMVVGPPVSAGFTARLCGIWPALSVSRNGALLYLPVGNERTLTWVDRQQRSRAALARRGPWGALQLSPDNSRVAVEVHQVQGSPGISIADLARGLVTPLASAGRMPVWTTDGRRIAFGSNLLDRLEWQASDGSGTSETLYRAPEGFVVNDGAWTPDARLTFTASRQHGNERAAAVLVREGASWVERPLSRLEDPEMVVSAPRVSPDGRWVAYATDASGSFEVWIQAYPDGGQRTRISLDGGYGPVWSASGREIVYQSRGSFFAVSLELRPTLSVGTARLIARGPYLDLGPFDAGRAYDVSRDGERLLVVQVGDEELAPRRLHLVQNWFEELRSR